MKFLHLILLAFVVGLAAPAHAADIVNVLPTGMQWQEGRDYEIPYSVFRTRKYPMSSCQIVEQPAGCQGDVYAGRIPQSSCTYTAAPDTCATGNYRYIPADKKSQARCTIVRTHTSESMAIDDRSCAVCSGGSCDFFIGVGALTKDGSLAVAAAPQTPTPADPPAVTGPAPSPSPGQTLGGQGTTGNGTGNGNGEAEPPPAVLENPLNSDSLEDLLLSFLRGIVRIAAIALLVFLVYVGFQFVAAQGNEEKLRTAKNAMLWTVIGGAILLGAEVIMGIIQSTANALSI